MFSYFFKNMLTTKIHIFRMKIQRPISGPPHLLTIITKFRYSKNQDIAKIGTFQGSSDGNVETKLSNRV